MDIFNGQLSKMETELVDNNIIYHLANMKEPVNNYIGKALELNYLCEQCISCNKKTRIYRQGYCYNCFFKSPETGMWVMKPELSTAHIGIEEKDLEYEKKIQLQDHIVYLAKSSEIKVGVTRLSQIPTRWIDQGAIQAMLILKVENRYLAGVAEVELKKHISDKTNWRKMLTNQVTSDSIDEHLSRLESYIPKELLSFRINSDIQSFTYPVLEYPKKVTSLNISKVQTFKAKLIGIKGQYFIFENGYVFNIRNNVGKVITMNVC